MSRIQLENVTKKFGKVTALDGVSLDIKDKEFFVLFGPAGAGKSTILKLLLGLYQPDQGEVLIHGMPAAAVRAEERRKLFGYVEQSFHMVPGTVKDQITLYDDSIPDEAVKQAAKMVGLDSSIEALEHGYDTICTPEVFSQGQWQLLSIARAAAAGPELLLLDETMAGLTATERKDAVNLIKKINTMGVAILTIEHNM